MLLLLCFQIFPGAIKNMMFQTKIYDFFVVFFLLHTKFVKNLFKFRFSSRIEVFYVNKIRKVDFLTWRFSLIAGHPSD